MILKIKKIIKWSVIVIGSLIGFILSLYVLYCVFVSLVFMSLDYNDSYDKILVGNYKLHWSFEEREMMLLYKEKEAYGSDIVVDETVFYVEWNNNFIIAKQHPNKQEEIEKRLFKYSKEYNAYLLDNPSDTIYLSKDDSIYKKDGKWLHISNGWNGVDSLYPYKGETFYHLIDIRNKEYKLYTFDSEQELDSARIVFNIPPKLKNKLRLKRLE